MSEAAANTASQPDTIGGEAQGETVTVTQPVHPYVHVVVVAVIGAVAVLAWLVVYSTVNKLLWENAFVLANPWMFPVICLPFSLLVGLLVKYRNAPTMLGESMLDSLSGDVSKIDWRGLPINIVMAWASLFSGAVLGPEGGIGGISSKVAALYGERVGIPLEHRSRLVFSTLASAYNGLVANPLFTGVLGVELIADPVAKTRNLPATLIGGSIGYLIFAAAGSTGLEDYLHLPTAATYAPADVLVVVLAGLGGLILALIGGALFQAAVAIFSRFEGREVERALAAGVVFSVVGIVAPIVMFSGETQIKTISADPASYGAGVLLLMAIVKLALLAVAFKSGFLGGPTFPAIFASVCVALAISLLLPGVSAVVLIGGFMAGFLTVLFKAPLMVVLLTVVMLQADPQLTALIVLAVAAVLVALPYVTAALAALRARRGSAADEAA